MEHDIYHCRPLSRKLKLDISVRIETKLRMDIQFINYNKQESKKNEKRNYNKNLVFFCCATDNKKIKSYISSIKNIFHNFSLYFQLPDFSYRTA